MHDTILHPSPLAQLPPEAEILRWDGDQVTLPADLMLDPPPGPVMVSVSVWGDPTDPVETVHQPMARLPRPAELLQLVAAARRGWTRTRRRGVVVRARWLDENEARAAWGDR